MVDVPAEPPPEDRRALYRRYRSTRFDQQLGQEHIVTALRNAVRERRAGHAYLFSGPRGTGKTSTARILAKALNCTNSSDGEPCGHCDSCVAIESGHSYDLHELDAASNNGVDAMRDLIAKSALGSPGRTKVYILDEVHMLSPAASAALLKTLEEPPPHVTFVLATTDPQKVLPTIRSRTQHYEFRLISATALEAHVRRIMADNGIELTEDAVRQVIRRGGGSARDTLSVLDQVAALGGLAPEADPTDDLINALADRDAAAALSAVAASLVTGREPRLIGETLLGRLRDAFLATMGAPTEHLSQAESATANAIGRRVGPAILTRAMEAVGQALIDMRQAPDPRVVLEVALLRLTRADLDTTMAALLQRVAELERIVASGSMSQAPLSALSTPPTAQPGVTTPAPFATPRSPTAAPPAARPGGLGPAAEARRRIQQAKSTTEPNPRVAVEPDETPASATSAMADAAPAPVSAAGIVPLAEAPNAVPVADATFPTVEQLNAQWPTKVLPSLEKRANVRFQAGRFIDVDGEVAMFGLPNGRVRDRCEECRPEVEAALARQFGRPIAVRLVVDDAGPGSLSPGGSPAPEDGPPTKPTATPRPPVPPRPDVAAAGEHRPAPTFQDDEPFSLDDRDDDIGDVHSLEDANNTAMTFIDRIDRHFPGVQVVE